MEIKIPYHKIVLKIIAVCLVLFGIPLAIHLTRMAKEYQQGPSVEAALSSSTISTDRIHGLYYKFEYQDRDSEGNTRYHFISTGGENVPKVVVCKFTWFDEWDFVTLPSRTPAGWQYIDDNREEWKQAFIAWVKSPNYDGRKLSPNYEVHVPKKPQEVPSNNDTNEAASNNDASS